MTLTFDHRDPGTDERHWAEAAPWQDAAALNLDCDRVVVVAAHPDDETLGAAGLIATARARGIPVMVIVLTDGHESGADGASPTAVARTRRRETVDALAELGDGIALTYAALPDGGLREHEADVRSAIAGTLSTAAAGTRTLLVTPWHGDGHRDHRIVGSVAARLAGAGVRVVQYPIWMWHWASSESVDTAAWRTLTLDDHAHAAKVGAVDRHVSQLTPPSPAEPPMLHAGMRSHFERKVEVYIEDVGGHDVSVDPSWFRAFYERHDDPWGFESRWYERRKRELIVASLPRQRYEHVLELGCATGLLTELLAARSARITAVDVVDAALAKAHARVPHARLLQQRAPGEWPDGRFDLVVLSELAYYWSAAELADALRRIRGCLAPDGELVVCHHRPRIDGRALAGDDVHAAIRASGLFRRVLTHAEDPFLLEVFRADDEESR
ncbi:hypothetical protein GCM10022200_27190 [Microbacterium awajiense]|uniref:Methyltransferase domain-containing protein n=1 Tax=Microbacterium awajiense TaxID=415214 RepID=A0ABP7AX93_9MICO